MSEALQQAPTLIELFTTRSKLLKHAGDYEGGCLEIYEDNFVVLYVVVSQ
jgi:hypothetical protein